MEEERYNTNRKTDTAQVLYRMKTDKTKGERQLRNREEGDTGVYDSGRKRDTTKERRKIQFMEEEIYDTGSKTNTEHKGRRQIRLRG